jgi:hypothetical protein
MMSANPPAKHHYIPRFQLAQWAVDNGKLWRFLQPRPGKIVTKLVAPAEIGYKKNLYITAGLPPERAQQVEQHFMSRLDDQAAEAHQHILAGKLRNLTQKQRSAWSRFIMSQWFRTPPGLRYFKEAMGHILASPNESIHSRYQETRQEGYPDSFEELVAMMNPDFADQTSMDLLRKMIDDPKNGLRLNNMPCLVIETTESHEFLISDAALQQGSAGIFSDQGYLTLPIAPRKLFVAATKADVVRSIQSLPRRDLIARHNRAVVRYASIFVGATDLSQDAFISANFGAEEHQTLIKGLADKYRRTAAEEAML